MVASEVRENIGLFLKDLLLQKKISIDDLQQHSQDVLNNFTDDIKDDKLLERIKALDDNKPLLTPIVLKLLGDWNKIST